MAILDDEESLLRSVALQNANSILLARQRAEEELLRTKEALRESQERLTAALTAAGTGTFRWNIQTNTVEWDGNLDRLFGLESDRTTQSLDAFIAAVHPDDRPGVIDQLRAMRARRIRLRHGVPRRLARRQRPLDRDKAKAFFDDGGRPLYMTGACADITSRKPGGRGAARERGATARDVQPGGRRDGGRVARWPLPRHEQEVLGDSRLQPRRAPTADVLCHHPPGRCAGHHGGDQPAARAGRSPSARWRSATSARTGARCGAWRRSRCSKTRRGSPAIHRRDRRHHLAEARRSGAAGGDPHPRAAQRDREDPGVEARPAAGGPGGD